MKISAKCGPRGDPIERPFAYELYVENIVVLIETFEIYKNNVAITCLIMFNNNSRQELDESCCKKK